MSKPVILVTAADLAPEAMSLLTEFNVVFAGKTPSEDDIVRLCGDHNPVAIIVRYGKVGYQAMDASPNLRVISKHGSGTDTIDKEAANERGIQVTAAVGANAAAVAEHAVALMLACAKSIVSLDARMRAGHWDKATHKSIELDGRVVGVVGLGAIGRRFAAIAHAMNMRVLGFDPYASPLPDYIELVTLPDLLSNSDVVSLHCPLTDENRNFINAGTLASFKRGAILVNTARGGLIDEGALLEAVRSGQLSSAGLDSFHVEPMLPSHDFHQEPRILLTPHIGGVTADAYTKMGVASVGNVLNVLRQSLTSVPV